MAARKQPSPLAVSRDPDTYGDVATLLAEADTYTDPAFCYGNPHAAAKIIKGLAAQVREDNPDA